MRTRKRKRKNSSGKRKRRAIEKACRLDTMTVGSLTRRMKQKDNMKSRQRRRKTNRK